MLKNYYFVKKKLRLKGQEHYERLKRRSVDAKLRRRAKA